MAVASEAAVAMVVEEDTAVAAVVEAAETLAMELGELIKALTEMPRILSTSTYPKLLSPGA